MTTIRLLVSPTAGSGTAGTKLEDIRAALSSNGFDVDVIHTTSAEHVTQAAADADAADIVAPLGGDGTLSLAVRGVLKSGAALLPLPAGRGNDFVRAVGLPIDTLRVAGGLAMATRRRIDVGMVGDRPFLGVASIGFDAAANTVANSTHLVRGPMAYTYGGVVALATTKPLDLTLTIDGGAPERVRAWNVAIGNSGRYGGGLKVCPDASLDDGLLDLVIYEGRGRTHVAAAALLARPGKHVKVPGVRVRQARRIEIDTVEPRVVYADGDPIAALPTVVEVRPSAIELVVPQPR